MFRNLLPFLVILPPLAYGLISLWCGRAYFSRRRPVAGYSPPVTILKPVKGMDADSYVNFASFCNQEYPDYQLLFALASADDPAIEVIERVRRDFPAVDIGLVVDDRLHGLNYKVCNLINAYPQVKHDIIIVCDSDIRVGSRYLQEVCAPFADPAVGLVTSLYRTSRADGVAAAIEALGFATEMVPNVMVALRLEGLSFALGASMAVRREALEQIGGFPALVDYLADDYQLGNQVCLAGWRLELSGYFVESIIHKERLANVLSRQLRWARTMRVSRPAGYLGAGITQPFPLAVLAFLVSGCSRQGIAAAFILYVVRSISAIIYSRFLVRDNLLPRRLWLLPLRDAFSFATWSLSFLGSHVVWRGHRFLVLPGGKLEEVRE